MRFPRSCWILLGFAELATIAALVAAIIANYAH
jgi:hypothetical protein